MRPLPIGGNLFTSTEAIEVRSPYDNSLLGTVPSCGPAEVDIAVAAAKASLATPIPAHERARILDAVADAIA
ncbi:MAG: aldehyde dehydrogenase family protein, partial [Actinomycetes bacterium]